MLKKIKNAIASIGIDGRKTETPVEETYNYENSYLVSPSLINLYQEEIKEISFTFYKRFFPTITALQIDDAIKNFYHTYANRPIKDNKGGSGYHNLFWLYTFTFLSKPNLIVESGTWKGLSSWCMKRAARDSKIYCFDLNFNRLIARDESFEYVQSDWKDYEFKDPILPNSFCFFDDHINQAERIIQAYNKGFKTLIFDDSPPAHKVYTFGMPPLPTVPMLLDERLNKVVEMEWVFKNKKLSFSYDPNSEVARQARSLILNFDFFPDVSLISQFDKNRFLTIVTLKE